MAYSTEAVLQVWDDTDGTRVEVGDDRDGLGMVEIRAVDASGKTSRGIIMTREGARLFCKAMETYLRVSDSIKDLQLRVHSQEESRES